MGSPRGAAETTKWPLYERSGMTAGYDWPRGFDRTHPDRREPYPHGFRVDVQQAFENILTQLERLGAEAVTVETAADHQTRNPNVPYAGADPDDPTVVVRYEQDGRTMVVPCDRWDNLRDNAEAVAKYIDAKRALDRYGIETRTTEWETQIVRGDDGGSSGGSDGGAGSGDDTAVETESDANRGVTEQQRQADATTTDTEVFSPDDQSCPECGRDVSAYDGAEFCPDCGTEL
jgi:hypothetical protein